MILILLGGSVFVFANEVGFGTYSLRKEAIEQAIQIGYRIIDTATFYENFDEIAEILKNHKREDLYIISKVWPDSQTPEALKKDLHQTLKSLHTDYLDAYLLHWPNSRVSIEETLGAMQSLQREKKIRDIGLSNVNVNHLKRALEVGVPIAWVQIEMHPLFCDFELLEFCKRKGIRIQAWAPLGRGRVSKDLLLEKIGNKYGKTASQVAIRWILQHGCVPLPCSKNLKHIRENFEVNDFTLSTDEMDTIDNRAKVGNRERVTKEMIGFDDEFDFTYEECWPR